MIIHEMKSLPVITLIQPWASWVAMGWKTGETRTTTTLLHRIQEKYFLVHAGKGWDEDWDVCLKWLNEEQRAWALANFSSLPSGEILAMALGGKLRPMYPEDEPSALIGSTFTKFNPKPEVFRRWILPLDRIEPLEKPVPARGQQGIWYFK